MRPLIFIVLSFLLVACSTSPSDAQTVYVTRTGEKYHEDGCRYLRSKIEIKLEKAIELGYGPCSVCRPPTSTSKKPASPAVGKSNTQQAQPAPSNPTQKAASVQCSAKTKAGTRCKRTTTSASGKCWQHE